MKVRVSVVKGRLAAGMKAKLQATEVAVATELVEKARELIRTSDGADGSPPREWHETGGLTDSIYWRMSKSSLGRNRPRSIMILCDSPYANEVQLGHDPKIVLPLISNGTITRLGGWAVHRGLVQFVESEGKFKNSNGKLITAMHVGNEHPLFSFLIADLKYELKELYANKFRVVRSGVPTLRAFPMSRAHEAASSTEI